MALRTFVFGSSNLPFFGEPYKTRPMKYTRLLAVDMRLKERKQEKKENRNRKKTGNERKKKQRENRKLGMITRHKER